MSYHIIFWKNSVTPRCIYIVIVCMYPACSTWRLHTYKDIHKTKHNENTFRRLFTEPQPMRRRFKHTPNHAEIVMEAALRQCSSTSFSRHSFHQRAKLIHPSRHWRYIIFASGKIIKYSMHGLIKPSISTTKCLEFVYTVGSNHYGPNTLVLKLMLYMLREID